MIYLDNIDNEIKKEMLVSLKEIVTKYPKLNNSISLVSDINYLVNYISNTYTLKDNEKYEPSLKTVFTTASMWLPKDNKKLGLYDSILYYKPDFIGIGVNEIMSYSGITKQLNSDYRNGWSCSRNIKDAIYHEIGHVFVKLFKLIYNPKMIEFIEKNINNSNLSEYSKINPEEMIAEAFSKYSYDPRYNDVVYVIGSIIEEFYTKFESTDLFEISGKSLIKTKGEL